MEKMKKNSGQALLIILLVMAVGLTVGLAVVSRSVTDISISRQEEESARVFSVAEAGIEEALKAGAEVVLPEGMVAEGITATVKKETLGGGKEFVFPNAIQVGDAQTVWLVEHDSDGNLIETPSYTAGSLDVCWEDTNPETALEVTIFYKDGGVYKIARGAYDAEAISRGNNFSSPDTGGCAGLGRKKILNWADFGINLDSNTFLLFLRLRPLYNQAKIGVASSVNLPSQGTCYESTATAAKSGITRKVQQCQFYKTPPAIFDYVLYSEGDLIK